MDSHAQRGLDEQRALCERERARVEDERRRAEPLVRARNAIAEYDVIQRIGRRTLSPDMALHGHAPAQE